MHKAKQPLAEVFGHLIGDQSLQANHYRTHRLCPFNNNVPNCTKDKAKNPLGVCSIFDNGTPVITCPVRFREHWLIAGDAAAFFFPEGTTWTSLTEVRLNDQNGKSAGNIDVVLVAYNSAGQVVDFGALEIQAVYISGNVRDPFEHYMQDPQSRAVMDWSSAAYYPKPDYLSSSRKRLAPQLLFKGGILHSWQKKMAVAVDKSFFATLPHLPVVEKAEADIVWLIYDLQLISEDNQARYRLVKVNEVYTKFEPALLSITTALPGDVSTFIQVLQHKLDEKMEAAPTNETIEGPF